jgi:hypothetical protein
MGRATKVSDAFASQYPSVAAWVQEQGWIELGPDEYSASFIRVLDCGGMVWEGKAGYRTVDEAFADADAAVAAWLGEVAPAPPAPAKTKPTKAPSKKGKGLQLVPVDSSMLTAVGYDEVTMDLVAVFTSGKVWRYRGVPKSVYKQLLAADSVGSFMRSCIIGAYPERPGLA